MTFLDQLVSAVGIEHVLTDSSVMSSYSTDWTGNWRSDPVAVVRPLNVEQVQQVLMVANHAGIAVITQGGNTGLVGGSVGDNKYQHIILSTKRIRNQCEFIADSRRLVVSAGITLAEVHEVAAKNNLEYGVDIAARDSATIGGTVATNAGGIHVVAHGMTSQQVCGLEIVLPSGEIQQDIDTNSSHYVAGLSAEVVGSEGTLGVITKVCLQLQIPRAAVWTALVSVDSIEEAIAISTSVGENILAAEIMQNTNVVRVAQHADLPKLGFTKTWVLLLESDGELVDLPDESIVGFNGDEQRKLWAYRERHTEFIATHHDVIKFDAKVLVSKVPAFIVEFQQITNLHNGNEQEQSSLNRPTLINIFIFGHLLDGNLHLALSPITDKQKVHDSLARLVMKFEGNIRAEHGIGQAKSPYLEASLTKEELAERGRTKDKFDPARIMNPSIL